MKRAAQQSVTTNRLRAGVRNSLIIGVGLLVAACQSQSQSSSSSMPSPSSPSSASSSSPSNPSPPSSSSSSSSSPSMPSSSQSSSPSSRSSSQPPSMPLCHLARQLVGRLTVERRNAFGRKQRRRLIQRSCRLAIKCRTVGQYAERQRGLARPR